MNYNDICNVILVVYILLQVVYYFLLHQTSAKRWHSP